MVPIVLDVRRVLLLLFIICSWMSSSSRWLSPKEAPKEATRTLFLMRLCRILLVCLALVAKLWLIFVAICFIEVGLLNFLSLGVFVRRRKWVSCALWQLECVKFHVSVLWSVNSLRSAISCALGLLFDFVTRIRLFVSSYAISLFGHLKFLYRPVLVILLHLFIWALDEIDLIDLNDRNFASVAFTLGRVGASPQLCIAFLRHLMAIYGHAIIYGDFSIYLLDIIL